MTSICWRQQNDLKLRGIEIEKFCPDFLFCQENFKFSNFFPDCSIQKKKSVKRTKE